jgi:hypothetical protein
VELVRNNGVLNEEFEGNDAKCVFVRRFENYGAGGSGLLHLQPASGAHAPAIAGLEAVEAILRHGRGEIVAKSLAGGEKGRIDDAADGVDT